MSAKPETIERLKRYVGTTINHWRIDSLITAGKPRFSARCTRCGEPGSPDARSVLNGGSRSCRRCAGRGRFVSPNPPAKLSSSRTTKWMTASDIIDGHTVLGHDTTAGRRRFTLRCEAGHTFRKNASYLGAYVAVCPECTQKQTLESKTDALGHTWAQRKTGETYCTGCETEPAWGRAKQRCMR